MGEENLCSSTHYTQEFTTPLSAVIQQAQKKPHTFIWSNHWIQIILKLQPESSTKNEENILVLCKDSTKSRSENSNQAINIFGGNMDFHYKTNYLERFDCSKPTIGFRRKSNSVAM